MLSPADIQKCRCLNLITTMKLDLPMFLCNVPPFPCYLNEFSRRFLAKAHLPFLKKTKQKCFGIIQNNQSNSEFSALFSELSEILLVESWVVLFFYFNIYIKKMWGLLWLINCYFSFIVQRTSRCITDRTMLCQIKIVLYRWHWELSPKWDYLMFRSKIS